MKIEEKKCAWSAGNQSSRGIGIKKLGYGSILYILRVIDYKRKKKSSRIPTTAVLARTKEWVPNYRI